MLLTFFYMVATWIQSWRLSSLKSRLCTALKESDSMRPSVVFYTAASVRSKEELNGSKSKSLTGNGSNEDHLSSSFCSNRDAAKLGDLLWYQGDRRLCTIFPQQTINVNNWLLYPPGKTMFPLLANNFSQISLLQDTKIHVLVEADMEIYNPLGSSKATKLEDYGTIVSWTSDKTFGVILETDLDHITKFSIALMHGQCFINNGLLVSRVESVSVSGSPCFSNCEHYNFLDYKKMIGKAQWDAYIKKLRAFSETAKLVSQQGLAYEVKDAPGAIITPGTHPISLQLPLQITIYEDTRTDNASEFSGPATPPPTPASMCGLNGTTSRLSQALTNSVELTPSASLDFSAISYSNTSLARSQDFDLKGSPVREFKGPCDVEDQKSYKSLNVSNETLDTASRVGSSRNIPSSIASTPARKTENGGQAKPPSVLIYGDSTVAIDSIKNVLETVLKEDKYSVYNLSLDEIRSDIWMEQAFLVVIYGNIGNEISTQLVDYMVRGGKLLVLCSDLLHILLPTFKTAEVRENELVRFSYGKWKNVRMMHHIFCYQPSPVKTKFSEEFKSKTSQTFTVKVPDKCGNLHSLSVKVLGAEETWHTPSILSADLTGSEGKAIFSQIHLEVDPLQYEFEESKFKALKESNTARLEIVRDLLSSHLDMKVTSQIRPPIVYTPGFFLGRHELKLEMLKMLKDKMQPNDVLKTEKMEVQFCGTSTQSRTASSTFLPVMVHRCPENFSTVEYFENLNAEEVGRLVIYSDIMSSSMDVVANCRLHHGLVVIPCRQTKGQGRGKNTWLSPKGCAMFTLQLHIPLDSPLGKRISLLQHLIAVAVVSAVKSIPGYEDIDLRVKWPNDMYASNESKIGGLLITTLIEQTLAICNIGTGVNLSNNSPTVCINELITRYNAKNGTSLKKLSYEQFLALVFTEIERILNIVQKGNIDYLYEIYYKYWLHADAEITIVSQNGSSEDVKVIGIDTYGFLEVKGKNGKTFTVHPDGNSFDIMKGLITPKT